MSIPNNQLMDQIPLGRPVVCNFETRCYQRPALLSIDDNVNSYPRIGYERVLDAKLKKYQHVAALAVATSTITFMRASRHLGTGATMWIGCMHMVMGCVAFDAVAADLFQ